MTNGHVQVGNFGDSSDEQLKRRLQSAPLPNYAKHPKMSDKNNASTLALVEAAIAIAADAADQWAATYAPDDGAPVSVGDTIRVLDKQSIIAVAGIL